MNNLKRSETMSSIALIIGLGLLAYTPLISRLGFYREDWYIIWNGIARGSESFIPLFTIDRPFLGYIYRALYPILGDSPLPWHFYALALRLLGALAFFWILRIIWPTKRFETTIAAVFFVVYPGFLQQPQANSFQIHLTGIFLALLSMNLMVLVVFARRRFTSGIFLILAFCCSLLYPFTMEYYIGLEGLRAAILWLALQQKENLPLRKALGRWMVNILPYLLAAGIFLFWRVFIFQSDRPAVDIDQLLTTYATGYWHYALRFVIEYSRDFVEAVFLAWGVPLYNWIYYGSLQTNLIAFGIALVGASFFWLYGRVHLNGHEHDGDPVGERKHFHFQWVFFGAVSVLVALFPIVAATQDIRFSGREDRFTLSASAGAVLLLVGLISYLLRGKARLILISILIGSAMIPHFNHALYMADYWEIERQLWWQLSWRVPMIKRNSLLLVNLPDQFAFAEDYEAWTPANLIYGAGEGRPRLTGEILYQKSLAQLQQDSLDPRTFRGIYLNRRFENGLVLSMPAQRDCLNVIDGRKFELSIFEEPLVQLAAPYSNAERLVLDADFLTPPRMIFGEEPAHTWCYFYQKAAYNRQVGAWGEIVKLGDEAAKLGYFPNNRMEWMPFFEAYANTGDMPRAMELAAILRTDFGLAESTCNGLNKDSIPYPGDYQFDTIHQLLCQVEGQ